MRFIIIAILSTLGLKGLCQNSYVYKKNVFGELEVYQSQGGLPTGSVLYKIKTNAFGYLEIENVDASINSFTKKPDYSAYSTFNNYKLPAKEIFATIDKINQRKEYDYFMKQPPSNNSEYLIEQKRMQTILENKNGVATAYLDFYKSYVSFPKTIKNGWYEVVDIFGAKKIQELVGGNVEYSYEHGICKVESNKIVEYYSNCNASDLKTGYVFQKKKLEVSGVINSCKVTIRTLNSNTYTSLYFMDNLLDSTKQITNPNFYLHTIYTSGNLNNASNGYIVQVARNKGITKAEISKLTGGPYVFFFDGYNLESNDCKNATFTVAIRKPQNQNDTFTIGLINTATEQFWEITNLKYEANTCGKSIIGN